MADYENVNECKCGVDVRRQTMEMENESFALTVLKDAQRNVRKWFAVTIVVLIMWFLTVVGGVWFFHQYEFENCNVSSDSGNANYNNMTYGDVINGKD